MKKEVSKEELRKEIKELTADIKKMLNCEKFAPSAWIKEIEEKCSKENQFGTMNVRNLIVEDGYWIVREMYYPGVDAEITNYYYFTQEPTVDQVDFMKWLSDAYADSWAGEAYGCVDVEETLVEELKKIKAKLEEEQEAK